MRYVIRIEGPYPVDAIVETTRSAVRLRLAFYGDVDSEDVAVLLTPTETAQLSVALQAAALEFRLKSGEET